MVPTPNGLQVFEGSHLDLFPLMSAERASVAARNPSPVDTTYVVVSFRHQESDSYFSEEMHEVGGGQERCGCCASIVRRALTLLLSDWIGDGPLWPLCNC
jgi:hypothetical protein